MAPRPRSTAGRPATLTTADIEAAGRTLGLQQLSLKAVAAALDVTTTALYRHVDGRWGLERLVGESILADLDLTEDHSHDLEQHLLSFALRLHTFTRAHPGLAGYLQVLFPRGEHGRQLLVTEIAALVRRGYHPQAATALCGAVATVTISLAAGQESDEIARRGIDFNDQRSSALAGLRTDPLLGRAHDNLPPVDTGTYVRLLLTATVRGLLQAAPPGRELPDILDDLSATGKDL